MDEFVAHDLDVARKGEKKKWRMVPFTFESCWMCRDIGRNIVSFETIVSADWVDVEELNSHRLASDANYISVDEE